MRNYIYFLFICIITFSSCRDNVQLSVDDVERILVVDAWLNTDSSAQKIILRKSRNYFDNAALEGFAGAEVQILRTDGTVLNFEDQGNGDYIWNSSGEAKLGIPGDSLALYIQSEGKTYGSFTTVQASPPIDTVVFNFEENSIFGPEGLYAEFFAKDLLGIGNTYWFKTYRNDTLLNKPEELLFAYDAGFTPVDELDGEFFIPPIRSGINRDPRTSENGTGNFDDGELPPWQSGDKFHLEVHGICLEAYFFFNIAQEQMSNQGIFAIPTVNSPSNVFDLETEEPIAGIFNVGEIHSYSVVIP